MELENALAAVAKLLKEQLKNPDDSIKIEFTVNDKGVKDFDCTYYEVATCPLDFYFWKECRKKGRPKK